MDTPELNDQQVQTGAAEDKYWEWQENTGRHGIETEHKEKKNTYKMSKKEKGNTKKSSMKKKKTLH